MSRQFDIFVTPGESRGAPMLMVLQSHLLPGLDTVLVAPLISSSALTADRAVFIDINVDETPYVLNLAQIASVSRNRLGRRLVSAADREDEIRRGLDRLFTGF